MIPNETFVVVVDFCRCAVPAAVRQPASATRPGGVSQPRHANERQWRRKGAKYKQRKGAEVRTEQRQKQISEAS